MHHHLVELRLSKPLVSHLRLFLRLGVDLRHRRSWLLGAVSRLSSTLTHRILVKILLLCHHTWVFIVCVLIRRVYLDGKLHLGGYD